MFLAIASAADMDRNTRRAARAAVMSGMILESEFEGAVTAAIAELRDCGRTYLAGVTLQVSAAFSDMRMAARVSRMVDHFEARAAAGDGYAANVLRGL